MDKIYTCDKGHKLTCGTCITSLKNKKNCKYCKINIPTITNCHYCSVECKFHDSYTVQPNGCHVWNNKRLNKRCTKPIFVWKKISNPAQHVSLMIEKIEIKKNHLVNNTCGQTFCVNKLHLIQRKKGSTNKGKCQLSEDMKIDILDKFNNLNWSVWQICKINKLPPAVVYRFIRNYKEISNLDKPDELSSDEDAQKELERIQKELGL